MAISIRISSTFPFNQTLPETDKSLAMGKKRKASGQPFGHAGRQKSPDANSKLHVTSYEDVADSEDEFHINRDKILLDEGPEQKRRRKIQEQGIGYLSLILTASALTTG